MSGSTPAVEVLRRARREAERYGDDPWVFLRELVQNARDAGASTIAISTICSRDHEKLICEDDGAGMSAALVETGLLRLFSSQKTHAGAAGCFGVGFWSTLRFDPITVRCDTNDGSVSTSIVVDVTTGIVTEIEAARRKRGTTITLERRPRDERMAENVRRATARSSGCIAPLPNRAVPILSVDGVDVRRRMGDDLFDEGDPRARVSGEGFEGTVGFSKRPRVEVQVHGLLVKEALSLDELLPSRASKTTWAPGLWPVVAVEAAGVTVLLDRQGVVEDALVRRIVDESEATLATLLEKVLDELVPLPWWRRLALRTAKRAPALLFAGALLVGAGAGAFVAREIVFPRRAHQLDALTVAANPSGATTDDAINPPIGAIDATEAASETANTSASDKPRLLEDAVVGGAPRVDVLSTTDPGWDIEVESDAPLLFLRMAVLDRIDGACGMIGPANHAQVRLDPRSTHRATYGATDNGARDDEIVVAEVRLRARGRSIPLPHAPGTRVDDVRIGGEPVTALFVDGAGLVRAIRDRGASSLLGDDVVRYRLVAGESVPVAPVVMRAALPAELVDEARVLRDLPPRLRVGVAEEFVRGRLRYATDAPTRDAIARARGTFYERVLTVGAGDCDVVNAVLAALLLEAGVPARVGVGLVAQRGGVGTALHAWTEAFVASDASDAQSPLEIIVADASPPVVLASLAPRPPVASAGGDGATTATARPGAAPGLLPGDRSPATRPAAPFTGSWMLWIAVASLCVSFALLTIVWRRASARRRRPRDGVDLTPLFVQALRRGDRSDPLGLRHRPLLPAHDGGSLSLDEAERLASHGALSFAHAGPLANRHAMSLRLRRGVRVLVADDARVKAVRPHLFGIVDLDRALELLTLPVDARARAVAAEAALIEPTAQARVTQGRGFVETSLPFHSPRTLFVLGADDVATVDDAVALYRRAATHARRVDGSAR